MQVTSLGFRTDLALRVREGAEITDRGDYTVVRSPDNPTFWWGNFLLLAGWPEPGTGDGWLARFAAEFPQAEHLALGVDAGHETAQVPPEFLAAGLEFERATVLSCAAVQPPPRQNTEAEIRRLESDDDWEQSRDLGVRCYGYGGPYLDRRARARRRLTQPGRWADVRAPLRPGRSARARSSSWPTRRRKPSASTAPAASPTRRASSA